MVFSAGPAVKRPGVDESPSCRATILGWKRLHTVCRCAANSSERNLANRAWLPPPGAHAFLHPVVHPGSGRGGGGAARAGVVSDLRQRNERSQVARPVALEQLPAIGVFLV